MFIVGKTCLTQARMASFLVHDVSRLKLGSLPSIKEWYAPNHQITPIQSGKCLGCVEPLGASRVIFSLFSQWGCSSTPE